MGRLALGRLGLGSSLGGKSGSVSERLSLKLLWGTWAGSQKLLLGGAKLLRSKLLRCKLLRGKLLGLLGSTLLEELLGLLAKLLGLLTKLLGLLGELLRLLGELGLDLSVQLWGNSGSKSSEGSVLEGLARG